MKRRARLEPKIQNEFGVYTPAPQLPSKSGGYLGGDKGAEENDRSHFLAMSKEDLVEELLKARRLLHTWSTAASSLVTALALAPESTSFYARMLRELLSDALDELELIDELRHVECSMPSIPSESPHLTLVDWRGLPYSTWDIQWSPNSWWVSVSAVGYRWGLSFNVLTQCSSITIHGRLRCAFSPDLTSVRLSFVQEPDLHMSIESTVGWGAVPIPVREQIESIVRAQILSFISNNLVGEESLVVVLRRKAIQAISNEDLQEARAAAQRATNVNLRPPSLLL